MLYIMRHGKTDWNAVHKLQGKTDVPLSGEGREMVEKAGRLYRDTHFDVCFCSPGTEHPHHRGRQTGRNGVWRLRGDD